MSDQQRGVVFPVSSDGRRSTAAFGRAVVADALREVDPVGAQQAERETSWRAGYVAHFRRLVEAGLPSPAAAMKVASAGLASVRGRLEVADAPGTTVGEWAGSDPSARLGTLELRGRGEAERELTLPLHGSRLHGAALHAQLDAWVRDGVLEPTAAEAVREVMSHPEWLRLEGRTVAVLGAGAEMGPLQALLRWGADVAAVDLPLPHVWERVAAAAHQGAGTVRVPVRPDGDGRWERRAGADLIAEVPLVGAWLEAVQGHLVVGNYVYADGATNVRVSAAVDALTTRVRVARPDTALAFLATPTDVFAVPRDAVVHSTRSYEGRSARAKLVGRPLRAVSGGRLLHRCYAPDEDPGVNDSLVPQQGPNYALAKRLQRWRAMVDRAEGATVSLNVAPPTRTRSVVKNRALAAAYAGAHRFGVEVFEPATSNVLMAALLVHDLHTAGGPRHTHPWQDEAHGAVHGGLWRTAYAPRSALGLAAVLGYGAARA